MKTTIALLFILVLSFGAYAAGEVDPTFNASVYRQYLPLNPTTLGALTTTLQPDGKLLVGGIFSAVENSGRSSLARLNADGTVDTSFNPPELYDLNNNALPGNVYSIALQSNGKIIVGGSFGVVGSTAKSLIRLNSDGLLDNSFNDLSAQFDPTELIYQVSVRPDDTIYISGYLELSSDSNLFLTSGMARFDSNGVLDLTYQFLRTGSNYNVVAAFAVTPNNTVYASLGIQSGLVGRYNSNGSRDTTFTQITADADVYKILIQPDGKVLLGGEFRTLNGFTQQGISRISSNGAIDTSFNSGSSSSGVAGGGVYDISFTADGKIVIVGGFLAYQNIIQVAVAKINFDGTRDTSFNSPFPGTTSINRALAVQNDGKIILFVNRSLERLNPNGTIDGSYPRIFFGLSGTVNDLVQQPDGKIIAGGDFSIADNLTRSNLVRFNTDGSLDASFSPNISNPIDVTYKIALQSDGKIVVLSRSGVLRLNTDGSRDMGFTTLNAPMYGDLRILADGKILVNGVTRLFPNGTVDNSYSTPNLAGGIINTTFIQPDGKILIGGTFTQVNATIRGRIARLNADGTLDTSFTPSQGANNTVNEIDLQSDGKVILVGAFTSLNGSNRSYIGRLNSDGSLDNSFSPAANNQLFAVKVQPDGKVLIGGTMTTVNSIPRNRYARLDALGNLDPSFITSSGANATVYKITLQADGKILLGGDFSRINNVSAVGLARLLNVTSTTRTRFDFDGDGRADISAFRPSSGVWYRLNSGSNNSFSAVQFGVAEDKIAPADYDGDGKTDLAVFRPSTGIWYLQRSTLGLNTLAFGQSGDVPAPGDFDGDGKADLAVFRPATGIWYLLNSSNGGVRSVQFGQSGDVPQVGDFDGDGKSDVSLYRPSNGVWYRLNSSNNQFVAAQFGQSGDVPDAADFDGDGKTDLAVFRPSTGTWYLQQSTAGFSALQFGISGDRPAAADFDGDGKSDVAVFRPSTGVWYINRSTAGLYAVQFGQAGDVPAESAFVP